jgi:hypothetical protein
MASGSTVFKCETQRQVVLHERTITMPKPLRLPSERVRLSRAEYGALPVVDGAGVPMENNGCRSATHPTAISDTITEARQRRPDRNINSSWISTQREAISRVPDNEVRSEVVDSVARTKHKWACWGELYWAMLCTNVLLQSTAISITLGAWCLEIQALTEGGASRWDVQFRPNEG